MNSPAPHSDLESVIRTAAPGSPARRRRLLVGGVLLAVLLLTLGLARTSRDDGPAVAYTTEPLARGDLDLTITATGNLEPTNEVTVGSELSGTTLEVYVDVNDRVTQGQPLAKLDTTKLTQQAESARAALASAQARVAQAEATRDETAATFARQQELSRLSNGRLPARTDLDSARAAAQRAVADVASARASASEAEAQLKIYESDLAKAVIKSPIDGIVLTRAIEPGQTVAASFTAPELFVIAENLSQMKLKVAIAEADIGRVREGLAATFTVDAWPARTYTATVTRVAYGSAVTDNVVTYETELRVANDDLTLRPGMTATADVRVAEVRSALIVPAAALRYTPPAAATEAAPKRSFVQSLIPLPPRGGNRGTGTEADARPAAPGTGTLWILRAGQPVAITVQTGLTDGRRTEVSAPELTEGAAVILRASTPTS